MLDPQIRRDADVAWQVSAVAAYGRLFQRVAALRLTHPELYTCHSNRAAALLRLGLFDAALLDAERCRLLAAESFKKCACAMSCWQRRCPICCRAFRAWVSSPFAGLGRCAVATRVESLLSP